MYASIRRYEGIDRDTAAELARRSHRFRERLSREPGFVAYEVVVDRDSIASITVFETWVTAAESNVIAAQWIRENMSELGLPAPQITSGEIYEEPGSKRPPFSPPPPVKVDSSEGLY